jgi:hypothetical protein
MLIAALLLITATKAGVTLPDSVDVEGHKLVLNGLGVREATVLNVDVYVAGLYLEKKTKNPQAIIEADAPKRLLLRFVRDVDRDDLTNAWKEGFEKNNGGKLAEKLKQLNGWMTSMKNGQSLAFTYLPGKGVTVEVEGKTKGTIEGADFARVMWAIFVGPEPPNEGLKSGLLGG